MTISNLPKNVFSLTGPLICVSPAGVRPQINPLTWFLCSPNPIKKSPLEKKNIIWFVNTFISIVKEIISRVNEHNMTIYLAGISLKFWSFNGFSIVGVSFLLVVRRKIVPAMDFFNPRSGSINITATTWHPPTHKATADKERGKMMETGAIIREMFNGPGPYKPTEVAKTLRCDPRTIQKACQKGEILAFHVGREYRIPAQSIEKMLNKGAA